MTAAARAGGASVELLRQDDFLVEWGLRDVVRELREQELALATSGDAMERLAVRSERTDAETLLHPRGLGDFRVMVARVG
jgi:SAM-dependent MidA family methyltransferase